MFLRFQVRHNYLYLGFSLAELNSARPRATVIESIRERVKAQMRGFV